MPDKKPLKPSQLGNLYPTAKTYDERLAERAQINSVKALGKPKHVLIRACSVLTLTGAVILLTLKFSPYLLGFNLIAGIFFAFGLLIGITFYIKWLIEHIIRLYDVNGWNAQPFLWVYAAFLSVFVVVLHLLGGIRLVESFVTIGEVLVAHFVLSLLLAWFTRNIGRSTD